MTSDSPDPTPETSPRPDGADHAGAAPELTEDQLEYLNSLFDLARSGRGDDLLRELDRGVPVNLADHKGDTLLILATYNDHPSLVRALLDRGAEVDRLNARGQSALTCAVFVQNEDSVRMLLDAGADPDQGPVSARAAVEMFGLDRMRPLLGAPPAGA